MLADFTISGIVSNIDDYYCYNDDTYITVAVIAAASTSKNEILSIVVGS